MPWNSVSDLPKDIQNTLPSGAQQLFLTSFDRAWNGTCKDKGKQQETCAFQQAWGAVRKLYKKEGNTWISAASIHTEPAPFYISSAKQYTITGPLVEIDKLNGNNWGIPAEEVETIISGLVNNPLKICSGKDAIYDQHSCDYNWDPGAAIGRIVSAHKENGWIHATAEVTDPTARSKINSRTWVPKWSIFGGYKFEDDRHMRYGTIPRSVTLVDNPAYPGAGFRQASFNMIEEKEHGNMTGNEDDPKTYTQEDHDKAVTEAVEADRAAMTKEQEDLVKQQEEQATKQQEADATKEKEHAAALEARDKQIKDLQAAAKTKDGDNTGDDNTVPLADVDKMISAATEGMVPREDVEKMVSAATEQATTNTMELLNKQALSEEIIKMQASFNMIEEKDIDTTKTALMEKSYAALQQDKDMLVKMSAALEAHGTAAVDKFKVANLPLGSNSTPIALSWDAVKQEWI
ncbi:MAG: hypothetical protein HF975_04205 [ANME-2 cluster archaeon]|nr:hypothetical protein [ANME-2 cluster archaeon]